MRSRYNPFGIVRDPNRYSLCIEEFMKNFSDTKEDFNDRWFYRSDDDVIKGLENIIMSCQRERYFSLRVISFNVIKDYTQIYSLLQEKYADRTKNGKKVDNPYDYINLRDSDIILLIVKYHIKINRDPSKIKRDNRTKELEKLEGDEEVYIIVPRFVNKYYYRIKGNYYAPMFQIVDGSTYNNSTSSAKVQSVTLKSRFNPIKMYREIEKIYDVTSGTNIKCVAYKAYIFAKKVLGLKYILAKYGYYGTMDFIGLKDIFLTKDPMNNDEFYTFQCRDKSSYVSVAKFIFDRDELTQSFVYTMIKSIHKYKEWKDIFNPRFWMKSLGGDFKSPPSIDSGISVLDSFEYIYDMTTKKLIRLPDEDKGDVYRILRWMLREFPLLKSKNNLDISIKMARMSDQYIDCIYAIKLSLGIYRISNKGESVRYIDVKRAINIDADYILKNIGKSHLVEYDDSVNDNDGQVAINFSYKGISGLGDGTDNNKMSNKVPTIYRTVHPSHLGRVELDSSSSSDPGMTGALCPLNKDICEDGSFTDFQEPVTWENDYNELLSEYREATGIKSLIDIKKKLGIQESQYEYIKEKIIEETINDYKRVICPIIDLAKQIDYSVSQYNSNITICNVHNDNGDGSIEYNEGDDYYDNGQES